MQIYTLVVGIGSARWSTFLLAASRSGFKEYLAINSRVIIAIDRAGNFPGEVLWQNQEFAGIQFLEEPEVVEEGLHRFFAMGET